MTRPVVAAWRNFCIAVLVALVPIESSLALERVVTRISFSKEGHCSAPRQGEVRREADYNIAEIIIDEEDGQWLERFVSECFALNRVSTNPREVYEAYRSVEESRCPGQSRWTVVLEEPHRILFEQHRGPCANEPGRLVLGLTIHGREDRWLLTYSAREPVRDPGDRQAFLDILEATEIVTAVSPTAGIPVWGPGNGPKWVSRLIREHEWTDGLDVVSPLPMPPDWSLAQRMHDSSVWLWITAFTPRGQDFDSASEVLSLTSVLDGDGRVHGLVKDAREKLNKRCGTKAQFNILVQTQDRIVTEEVASECRTADYAYRLTVYLQGRGSLFRAEYLARKSRDPTSLHDTWTPRMLAIGIRPLAGKEAH